MTEPHPDKKLHDEARTRMQDLPAETALGNRDPRGSGNGKPSEFEGNPEQQE